MIKLVKNRNPKLKYKIEEILSNFYPDSSNITAEYIDKGWYAHAYKLRLESKKLFNNTLLTPNTYVVKILLEPIESDHRLDKELWKPLSNKEINRLKTLSKYGLIPKIYNVDKYIIIMKYVSGKTLKQLLKNKELNYREFNSLIDKIEKVKFIWEKLGFQHGDLHEGNIIVSGLNKVYFIDPSLNFIKKNRDDQDLEELKNKFYTY